MIVVYASLINGGLLIQPSLVKKVIDANGGVIRENAPNVLRKIISDETSQTIRTLLLNVVKIGTGKKASVEGINIGGKTGTTRTLVNGTYSKEFYNSSFIGFFPAENPTYLCLIVFNSPSKESYYGGDVAAPVFQEFVKQVIEHSPEKFNNPIGDESIIKISTVKNGDEQLQFAENETNNTPTVTLPNTQKRNMPDVKGMAVRDAIKLLNNLNILFELKGFGKIQSQSITPGDEITDTDVCILNCAASEEVAN